MTPELPPKPPRFPPYLSSSRYVTAMALHALAPILNVIAAWNWAAQGNDGMLAVQCLVLTFTLYNAWRFARMVWQLLREWRALRQLWEQAREARERAVREIK